MPQYLVHTPVELLPLSEPDKRISHTSGSSVAIQQASALRHGCLPIRIRQSHRGFTPCIVSMLFLSRSTIRGDLRSAGVSRVIAMTLRRTGPHHSRRGHSGPSFYIGRGTQGSAGRVYSPRALLVARLVTCLSLNSSMLSGTPGCRLCARLLRARRLACACMERIGTFPK